MKITSLHIENFRAIENLEANGFGQVNLLTGANNSGKTSVLEALFLIAGMSNPELLMAVNGFRDLSLVSDDDFLFLFRDFDKNNNFSIRADVEGRQRSMTVSGQTGQDLIKPLSPPAGEKPSVFTSLDDTKQISGLSIQFIDGKNIDGSPMYSSVISLSRNEIKTAQNYKEKLHCSYLNSKLETEQLDSKMETLSIQKRIPLLVDILHEIDPRLTDIRLGVRTKPDMSARIYADIGMETLSPVNLLGDGFRQILAIIASISACENGVLLIDEIENGVHVNSLPTLWKAVFKAAQAYNVQLFITTHSYECVNIFNRVYKANTDGVEAYLYRIGIRKKTGEHRIVKYEPDVLDDALETNWEVR
jgi:energy-coupling factor transporter ATP-binding protein EcfA2